MSSFEHDALIYDGVESFVQHTLPFVRDGLDCGDAVLAVTTPRNIDALREALNGDAHRVDYRDSEPWYVSPGKAFRGYADYVAAQPPNRRLRAIGEPVWPVDSPAAIGEWARYESVLNVAFADAPAWIVCPYDARSLPDDIIDHARHTHPTLHAHGSRLDHGEFVPTEDYWAALDERSPFGPHVDARVVPVTADLAGLRGTVAADAVAAGVSQHHLGELLLAVHEVAINALTHGGGEATLVTWVDGRDFVCEIADSGRGFARAYAGYGAPDDDATHGRGLCLARLLADIVEVRSGPEGTRVRLRIRRSAD